MDGITVSIRLTRVPAGPCCIRPVQGRGCPPDTPDEIVSRPAGYLNSIFREGLLKKAGYVQMNDWSRLAVDLNEKQKLGAEKSNCTPYKYAPERRTGPRPLRKRELTNPNRREAGRGTTPSVPSGRGRGQLRAP